jgi:peptidoglycan/xylan/chitin deacetylase (PgdA/CDA1 family)
MASDRLYIMKKHTLKIISLIIFYLLLGSSYGFLDVHAAALEFPVAVVGDAEPMSSYELYQTEAHEGASLEHFLPKKLKTLLQQNKRVVFTFDDGPHPNATPQILEVLKKHNLKAIFFVLGLQAAKYPELVKMIHDHGHIIGNHTYNHKYLSELREEEVRYEIKRTNDLIYSITGVKPTLLRPPYGAGTKSPIVTRVAEEEGMSLFLWTVDSRDWKSKNERQIVSAVESQLGIGKLNRVGGAILLHDIYRSTANSLEAMIASINDANLRVIDARELKLSDDELLYARRNPSPKNYSPELSGNKVMVALLSPVKKPLKALDILRAHRDGSLMLFLALNK